MKRTTIFLAAALLSRGVLADPGVALRADTLRAEPSSDAHALGKMGKGEKVDIKKKKGGWIQVKGAAGTGWVRILSVRGGAASGSGGAGDAAALLSMGSGRGGSGNVVATAGIRGLNEEDLKGAKFDEAELKRAEATRSSAADARQFATAGSLKSREVAFLPDPQKKKREGQESPWGSDTP